MTEYEQFAERRIRHLQKRRVFLFADLGMVPVGGHAEKNIARDLREVEIDIGLIQGRVMEGKHNG